jgi:hypothetical protein
MTLRHTASANVKITAHNPNTFAGTGDESNATDTCRPTDQFQHILWL